MQQQNKIFQRHAAKSEIFRVYVFRRFSVLPKNKFHQNAKYQERLGIEIQ
ncbi:hypothetical protein J3L21_18600 [Mucilaginibacter rubeus]|uniref:Uncharacterized protein n=1 Tax=Mucilaginibacter rubeus TaxID=2027860 RepID=A0ABX7U423_9SPHI|nr:hypothetical protein [Mucilaginibacter rubeus]QTE40974.1 hypothetical protein J3L19_18625 [Mucilaginibacter rubeus]QTE47577.1 hypothetical protein J3L21_18600 [Mucilaginibacter rubeus]